MDQSQLIEDILKKVRDALFKRGTSTIRQLSKTFRQFDSFDGNSRLDRDEFIIGLKQYGIKLNKQESIILYDYFDKNKDGSVDFNEFLIAIRGQMNQARREVVLQAFKKFDKDGSGVINSNDLRGVYNTKFHPKVQKGELTEDQVFLEFLQQFGDSNRDGQIVIQEWLEYYDSVSASIDNDEHFITLVKSAWKL